MSSLQAGLHGLDEIRDAYLRARTLNDLSFFHPELGVITQWRVVRLNGTNYLRVMDACMELERALRAGDAQKAGARLERLFLDQLKDSFSFSLCKDVLSFLKSALGTLVRAYVHPLPCALDALCDLQAYHAIEDCHLAF